MPTAARGGFPYNSRRRDCLPVPADFAIMAARLTENGLVAHYGHHWKAIRRWSFESGIEPLARPLPRPKPEPTSYQRKSIRRKHAHVGPKSLGLSRLAHTDTPEGRAADVLRKYAPVYRCSELGGVPEDKSRLTHWRYGNAVMTAAELADRAKAKGWNPDSWMEIAA